jgi:hypothetical protein
MSGRVSEAKRGHAWLFAVVYTPITIIIIIYQYTFRSKPVKGRQVTGHQFGRTLLLSSYFYLVFFRPYTSINGILPKRSVPKHQMYSILFNWVRSSCKGSLLILDGCPRLLVTVYMNQWTFTDHSLNGLNVTSSNYSLYSLYFNKVTTGTPYHRSRAPYVSYVERRNLSCCPTWICWLM